MTYYYVIPDYLVYFIHVAIFIVGFLLGREYVYRKDGGWARIMEVFVKARHFKSDFEIEQKIWESVRQKLKEQEAPK